MQPFDDLLPEEQEEQASELIAMLQPSNLKNVEEMPTMDKQEQMLKRVRQRLLQAEQDVSTTEQNEEETGSNIVQPERPVSSTFVTPAVAPHPVLPLRRGWSWRSRRNLRLSGEVLVAVLLIGILVSIWQAALHSPGDTATSGVTTTTHSKPSTAKGNPVGPVKSMVNVQSSAGGLDAAFLITPGPYFLSEVLLAKMTLTNHSQQAVQILRGSCGYMALRIDQSGGTNPKYQLPLLQIAVHCPGPILESVLPGQTITVQDYIVLSSSGAVTLTENASFAQTTTPATNGQQAKDPLAGHWPTLHINVASQVPTDRVISLQENGTSALVTGPKDALPHLIYQYAYSCVKGTTANGASIGWLPLTQPRLYASGCSATSGVWTYVVGSPGYAVASGKSGR